MDSYIYTTHPGLKDLYSWVALAPPKPYTAKSNGAQPKPVPALCPALSKPMRSEATKRRCCPAAIALWLYP